MVKESRIALEELIVHFEELEDPRSEINIQHPLISVVMIAMMAVLAGAGGPTAIARWAQLKSQLLLEALDLPNGIPRKDVFRRVLATLRPDAFQSCFGNWLQALRESACLATGVTQPVLAIDGKTLRRSHDRKKGLGAMHSVSVWASEYGLSLGQVACAEKSNEITAIPELLRLVDIKGAIITIDAMGTQKAIGQMIVEGEADYVLALKGNQETLKTDVVGLFLEEGETNYANPQIACHRTTETGHGRTETRTYYQMPAPTTLHDFLKWKGLKTIGMVISHCVRDGKETVEIRHYISSLSMNVKRFAHSVRAHWAIENTCHWTLDFTYREDESRIREKTLRENLAWLKRFTLSLLKQHPSKLSIAMKRQSCGWDEEFLVQVLMGKAT